MTMDASARVLERYNAKVFKNRKEHMLRINPEEAQQITANTRAIPGIMTNRGCCYAGCKGVVLGPIKDMVLITHGPVAAAFTAGAHAATRPGLKKANPTSSSTASPPICRSRTSFLAAQKSSRPPLTKSCSS